MENGRGGAKPRPAANGGGRNPSSRTKSPRREPEPMTRDAHSLEGPGRDTFRGKHARAMEQRRPHDGYEEQFDDDEHEDEPEEEAARTFLARHHCRSGRQVGRISIRARALRGAA